jgi:excisionase family DNA binding protein
LKDIQEKLQISRVTALRLVGSGRIKAQKIGRKWWVNEEDFIDFLEGRTVVHKESEK